jgi:hypothetical protein
MVAPEQFESFARGTHAALFHVLHSLTDAFQYIGLRGDIQQALIGFCILYDCFRFSIDRKNERFFRLFEMLHELRWIAPECRHGLNVFFYVEHEGLARQS